MHLLRGLRKRRAEGHLPQLRWRAAAAAPAPGWEACEVPSIDGAGVQAAGLCGSMKYKCPHCAADAVPGGQVRRSSRGAPAVCEACGRLSHVIASQSSGIATTCVVLLCIALMAGLVLQSWLAGIAGGLAVAGYYQWAWQRAELWPISLENAETAKHVGWWTGLVAWIAAIFSI